MNTSRTEKIDPDTGEITQHLPMVQDTGMVTALVRAELDTQIATAKQYPRSLKSAIDAILSLATLDEETAAECLYSMPRGGKPIRGPSIRLAEVVAQQWGNCRVDARVIAIDRVNKIITAEGTFHDLETNSAVRSVVQRRISDKHGRVYGDDMVAITGNACASIARRNAILAGVPKAVWRRAYEAAEHVTAGDIKTLSTRREAAIKAFGTYGVKPEQVFAVLDIEGIEDISLEHIPTLLGMYSALRSGEATVEEMFNPRRAGRAFDVVTNPLRDEAPAPASDLSDSGDGDGGGEQARGGLGDVERVAGDAERPAPADKPQSKTDAATAADPITRAKGV